MSQVDDVVLVRKLHRERQSVRHLRFGFLGGPTVQL